MKTRFVFAILVVLAFFATNLVLAQDLPPQGYLEVTFADNDSSLAQLTAEKKNILSSLKASGSAVWVEGGYSSAPFVGLSANKSDARNEKLADGRRRAVMALLPNSQPLVSKVMGRKVVVYWGKNPYGGGSDCGEELKQVRTDVDILLAWKNQVSQEDTTEVAGQHVAQDYGKPTFDSTKVFADSVAKNNPPVVVSGFKLPHTEFFAEWFREARGVVVADKTYYTEEMRLLLKIWRISIASGTTAGEPFRVSAPFLPVNARVDSVTFSFSPTVFGIDYEMRLNTNSQSPTPLIVGSRFQPGIGFFVSLKLKKPNFKAELSGNYLGWAAPQVRLGDLDKISPLRRAEFNANLSYKKFSVIGTAVYDYNYRLDVPYWNAMVGYRLHKNKNTEVAVYVGGGQCDFRYDGKRETSLNGGLRFAIN